MATQVAALQAEFAGVKVDSAGEGRGARGDDRERRARGHSAPVAGCTAPRPSAAGRASCQLALGDLLTGEAQLQKDLAAVVGAATAAAEPAPDPTQRVGGGTSKPRASQPAGEPAATVLG
jgi:hypothetical protein